MERLTKINKQHLYGVARQLELPEALLEFDGANSERDLRSSFLFWQSLFRQLNSMGFLQTSPTTLRTSIGQRGIEFMDKYHGVDENGVDIAVNAYLPLRHLFPGKQDKVLKVRNPLERRGRPRKVVPALESEATTISV